MIKKQISKRYLKNVFSEPTLEISVQTLFTSSDELRLKKLNISFSGPLLKNNATCKDFSNSFNASVELVFHS